MNNTLASDQGKVALVQTKLNMKQFTRREAIKGSGAVATIGLAGCLSNGDGNGGGGNGSTNIVIWHGEAEQEPKAAVNKAIKAFNKEHSDIQAEAQSVDERKITNQVIAGSQTGTLPNIVAASSRFMGQLLTSNLISTDATARAINEIGQNSFLDAALTWAKAGDKYMMVPFYAYVSSFWWRKSVFEENNLSKPDTWKKLRASAQKLTKPNQNQYGIAFGTEKHNATHKAFEAIALSNGGRILNKKGDVVFDSPEIVESLEFYAELAEYNPPGKHNFNVPRDLYINQSVQNAFWSSFLMSPIYNSGGKEMAKNTGTIKFLKHGNSEAMNGLVNGFGILNTNNRGVNQAQVDASIELAKWLLKPESYIPILLTRPGGYRPIVKDIFNDQKYRDSPIVQAWSDTMQQMSETLSSPKLTRFGLIDGKQFPELGGPIAQNVVAEAVVKVIDGGDAKQVASEYATKIENSLQGQ